MPSDVPQIDTNVQLKVKSILEEDVAGRLGRIDSEPIYKHTISWWNKQLCGYGSSQRILLKHFLTFCHERRRSLLGLPENIETPMQDTALLSTQNKQWKENTHVFIAKLNGSSSRIPTKIMVFIALTIRRFCWVTCMFDVNITTQLHC